MLKKESTYLRRSDEDFDIALEAMQLLRKNFLTMPFEEFVEIKTLRQTHPDKTQIWRYLIGLYARLDFGTDSYRYFMQYLRDPKTAEVSDSESSHNIHTDFRGRCEIRNAHTVLGYAMGFMCLDKELDVESLGYETDPGYIEETIPTELGDVLIGGCKNSKGNYHGYCQIKQADGALQYCFFDDGKILARRIYYANGIREDVRNTDSLAVDPFAERTVYEISENNDSVAGIEKIAVERDFAEEIFNILSEYSLQMECIHEKRYPYDDDTHYETEKDSFIPGINTALLKDGKLYGVAVKTNGYSVLPLDDEMYSSCNRWKKYIIELDRELSEGNLKISLRKKST